MHFARVRPHDVRRVFVWLCVSAGSFANLPACPCLYPSDIFYDNEIWDEKLKKTFQWRDVSHHTERLQIYKPGAVYCVQTLSFQASESAVTQHCCYDGNKNLLTRGSGAGTPYIISPDISTLLHDKIDLMPWRLCKGDFTRYALSCDRIPNIPVLYIQIRNQNLLN